LFLKIAQPKEKHGLLAEFLKMIGVDENVANLDADGIEHHLHPETSKNLHDL
jgi:DtxR family manganese transport transcriptional regulator